MTYWADNIKFIKDVLDSKYKKIEDSLADVSFMMPGVKITFLSKAGPIQNMIIQF